MAGPVYTLLCSSDVDEVWVRIIGLGDDDLCGSSQLQLLEFLAFPSDDEAMVFLWDADFDISLFFFFLANQRK